MCNGESIGLLGGISARRSCRAYKDTQLNLALLKSVFEYATFSPSAKNAQPWEVYVVTGDRLVQLKNNMQKALEAGDTTASKSVAVPKAQTARMHGLSADMAPYIVRQGWKPAEFVKRSIGFFGAPAAVIICLDQPARHFQELDIGAFMQTLALSATGHGLGTCIIGYSLIVEKAMAEFLQLPPERKIMITMALGFPDQDQPITEFESSRADLEENIHFL